MQSVDDQAPPVADPSPATQAQMPAHLSGASAARNPAQDHRSIRVRPANDPEFGRIWIITAAQTLPRPFAEVFPFFADAYNLEKLTPPFLNFRVLTPKPIDIRTGCIIDYSLRVHRVPLRWKTEILDWDPPHRFTDNQAKGPYALWHHTHSFEPIDHGRSTLCTDTVSYRPRGGPLAPLINRLFVQKDVQNIFRYRFEKLSEFFPQHDGRAS